VIEINEFRRNQSCVPLDELQRYNGQYVAWSHDGTHILASDADAVRLCESLRAAGLDTGEVLISYIEVPEDASCGGVFLSDAEAPE
jgi:hypothetical protein